MSKSPPHARPPPPPPWGLTFIGALLTFSRDLSQLEPGISRVLVYPSGKLTGEKIIGEKIPKARGNGINIRSIWLNDVDCWCGRGQTVSTHHQTFDSTRLHERSGIQSQAAAAVITMDTDMDASLRYRLVRRRVPKKMLEGAGVNSPSSEERSCSFIS